MPSLLVDVSKDSETFMELINLNTDVPVRVTGTSMLPFLLPDKDVVTLRKYNGEHLCEGQIVLFRSDDGHFVLHRIFEILDDGFLKINGDAQLSCEIIKTVQVLATVKKVMRDGTEVDLSSEKLIRRQKVWKKLRLIRPVLVRGYKILNRG